MQWLIENALASAETALRLAKDLGEKEVELCASLLRALEAVHQEASSLRDANSSNRDAEDTQPPRP